jgi:hypothetical protein
MPRLGRRAGVRKQVQGIDRAHADADRSALRRAAGRPQELRRGRVVRGFVGAAEGIVGAEVRVIAVQPRVTVCVICRCLHQLGVLVLGERRSKYFGESC